MSGAADVVPAGPSTGGDAEPTDADGEGTKPVTGSSAYRWSHRAALVPIESFGATPDDVHGMLGGIVVPTFRDLSADLPGLRLAVQLAHRFQCPLLVVCSRDARAADFPAELLDGAAVEPVVVDLDHVAPNWLPYLALTRHRLNSLWRSNDVGPKRNLALAVAARYGWPTLLFIDDDVSPARSGPTLDADGLAGALHALRSRPELRAVGWTLRDFDDNSVVGHARRLAGMAQDIFIGGGALLTRVDAEVPFFPDIYNEDWLFLVALAAGARQHRTSLGHAGTVRQKPYNPFTLRRARSEEAGEILGEGVFNLFEDDGPSFKVTATGDAYWRRARRARYVLVRELRRRLQADDVDDDAILDVLDAASDVHRQLRPADLSSYVRTWLRDLVTWQSHLSALQSIGASAPFTTSQLAPRADLAAEPPQAAS